MRSIASAIVVVLSSIVSALAAAPPRPADVATAEALVAAQEYEPSRHGDGWQAPNREQGFRVTFDGRGIQLVPRTGDKTWTFGLQLAGDLTSPTVRVEGTRLTYDRGRTVEWYVNGEKGLEQGFTLSTPGRERGEVKLALDPSGTLVPVLENDRRSIELRGPDGRVELVYSDLAVKDAVGRELPARLEVAENIRLVFDDTGATYPVTIDPVLKGAATTLSSGQAASWFGYSVATAGDVNGDGYSDVIVGAPLYDNGQDAEGRAFLYLGGPNGLGATPAWTTESDVAQANLGWVVAAAGDVNGDGYADVIVTEPGWNNGAGQVWVFYGNASGLPATVSWFKLGSQPFGAFGSSAATAGDVNGDGYSDIIVGAPSESDGQSLEGKAYVFMGSPSGLAATSAWFEESNQANADFGASVASAGDVNGDGYDDIIVSADQYDDPELGEGRVWVYLGGPGGLGLLYQFTAEGNQAGANFGASVAGAGDVNGDGYADIIIGAPGWDDPENAEGRAVVYYGGSGGVGGPPQWTFELNVADAHLGNSVATAGDVNGDGFADVIVGASQYTGVDGVDGEFLLFTGALSGLSTTPAYSEFGFANERLGISVGTAGDVDGDGLSDLVVGGEAPLIDGRAHIYRFTADVPKTTPAWSGEGNQSSSAYGVSVASAGDVNGDGFSDVLVGSYLWDNGQQDEGKADLYLGSASGLQAASSWTVESNVVVGELGISLDTAGDVNGDGYSDVIVGAPGDPNAGARVYLGGPGGLATSPAWTAHTLNGPSTGSFGISVASAGDVNGDGYSDVIVGAEGESGPVSQSGAAFVYLGSATGLSPTPAWTVYGTQSLSKCGHSVASAGDINGDGYSDVLVGCPGYTNGTNQEGIAYLYLGGPTGLSTVAAWSQEGNALNAQFGLAVASAGDVNGDGYSDVLVNKQAVPGGPAVLWLGGPNGLTVDANNTMPLDTFAVAAGDIDNDGFGDVLTGFSFKLWRGSASGQLIATGWAVSPGPLVTNLGHPIASAGDINGDGFPDVIVGVSKYTHDQTEEGAAFLYLGGGMTNGPISRQRGPRQLRQDGTTIGLYGKSDLPSGFSISANAMTAAGRTHVKYVWEVKPLGAPFNGSGTGSTTLLDTGAPTLLTGSIVHVSSPVSGLSAGYAYHWRARSQSANPFFPRTQWLSSVGNTSTETKLRMFGCADADGDGYGRNLDPACGFTTPDCNDADGFVWSRPGETRNLRFASKTTLVWDLPADLGAASDFFDVLRATSPTGFGSAVCVESNEAVDLTAFDNTALSPGQVFYYLTRAENLCPTVGLGSLGTDGNGNERIGRNCP